MTRKASGGGAQPRQTKQPMPPAMLIGGIALIAIAVLIVVWLVSSPNRGSGGTPQIQVSSERLELGKQIFGEPVRASFRVH